MKTLSKKVIALGLILALGSIAQAKVYATVDGESITEKDLEAFQQMMPGFNFERLPAQQKTELLNSIIDRKLILKSAKSKKYDTHKEYKDALKAIQENILIDYWSRKTAEVNKVGTLNNTELQKIYNENKDRFVEQTGNARHILVKTEAEAKAIINELNQVRGNVEPKFIDLANSKSIDPASQSQKNGGDLGTFNRISMVPEFSKAAFNLKPKTYTKTPVKTEFGYHIIYLNSKSDAKTISFEQAKPLIENDYKMQNINGVLNREVQKLRSAAKISIK